MLLGLLVLLAAYAAACSVYHRYIRQTGSETRLFRTLLAAPLADSGGVGSSGGDEMGVGLGSLLDSSGVGEVVGFYGIAGDIGTALVAQDVLVDRVYFRHGIRITPGGEAPLVVDIGAHVGLFSLAALRERDDAVVVAAEPVPELHELATKNAAAAAEVMGGAGVVLVEGMALGDGSTPVAALVEEPLLTAATTAHWEAVTQPLRSRGRDGVFAILRAIGLDSVRAGAVPMFPTAAVCHALEVPVLRVAVVVLALPVLLLAAIFVLTGPHARRRHTAHQGTLNELLQRAAEHARASLGGGRGAAVAQRIHSADQPIDLVKVNVAGGEWDVLRGFTDAEWQRIRQLVVVVHDLEGRVDAVRHLLADRGFNHVVIDDSSGELHHLLRVRVIYAKKIPPRHR